MTRRVWLRAAALAGAVVAVIVGLTLYFSSESVPPCLASGAPRWHAPTDNEPHRFMLVVPPGAACFFALDDEHKLVGTLDLPQASPPSVAAPLADDVAIRTASGPYTLDLRSGLFDKGGLAPFDYDPLTLLDQAHRVLYVTQRGLLGFRVIDLSTGSDLYVIRFKGFTWNPGFGPNPPSHGLALAPDRPQLWVLDAPNRTLHLFDVSGLPQRPPRRLADVRLERTMSKPGSLLLSGDGRFLYVGESGDVIDTQTRTSVIQLAALKDARALLEVDWVDGRPVFPGYPR
ncbi:MAG: YncE family protein [Gaiellaceae bacterium]